MVEQTHLSVSHTKDGKFVINANGNPQVSLAFLWSIMRDRELIKSQFIYHVL